MKTWWLSAVFATVLALAMPHPLLGADGNFQTALTQAYIHNFNLHIARSQLSATDEKVALALAARRPTASAVAMGGKAVFNEWPYSSRAAPDPKEVFRYNQTIDVLDLNQVLYSGGALDAQLTGAEAEVLAGRASLTDSEQQVLLAAATAYLNLWLAQYQLAIQQDNEQDLRRQWELNQRQLQRGDITVTDLSQTQTRLAQAQADRTAAGNAVSEAKIEYHIQVGEDPPERLITPPTATHLPTDLAQALSRALTANPALASTRRAEQAAQSMIDVQAAGGKPSVKLSYQQLWTRGPSEGVNRLDQASLLLNLNLPIYQGGAVKAQVQGAIAQADAARMAVEKARRSLLQATTNAWHSLEAANASVSSYQTQVAAAELARKGVDWETARGLRSVLDQLNARRELNNARLSLQQARHDRFLAQYQLLSALGGFTARGLGLDVEPYDPQAHYQKAKQRWRDRE